MTTSENKTNYANTCVTSNFVNREFSTKTYNLCVPMFFYDEYLYTMLCKLKPNTLTLFEAIAMAEQCDRVSECSHVTCLENDYVLECTNQQCTCTHSLLTVILSEECSV